MTHIRDLKPDPKNSRRHNPRNVGIVENSIQRDGFGRSILIANDGTIIAGNATYDASSSAGIENMIVVESDGTKVIAVKRVDVEPGSDRFHNLAIADNRAAELADWDPAILQALAADIDLAQFFRDDELDVLLASLTEPVVGLTDPDDVPSVPEVPVTKPGDLWLLGRHRLLCGDATVVTDVERLLEGVVPSLTVTDPPYGVDYKPDWRSSLDSIDRATNEVTNDDRIDWSEAFSLVPSDVIYCWHADRHASEVQRSLEFAGYEIRSQIIWAKPHFALSRGHYHWQHEPCWYAVRKGATASWVGDHSQSTLWQIDNATFQGSLGDDDASTGHGTQKPVECMERPLRNHEGDVYDPFSGSGTAIIAAEKLGRICYGMDIDPRCIDQTVTRWERFTGGTAVLAHDHAMVAD